MVRLSKVTVNLIGGVGNQLFCYFAGMAHALRFGKDITFNLATVMKSAQSVATIEELNLMGRFAEVEYPIWKNPWKYKSKVVGFDKTLLNSKRIYHIEGYFQSFLYYDLFLQNYPHWKPTLSSPGSFFLELKSKFQSEKPIVMHLRRGDYKKLQNTFGLLSASYYLNCALQSVKDHGLREVQIFGDEPSANKSLAEHLSREGFGVTVVDPMKQLTVLESLILMSYAGINIIGNSTFGWWSARFNQYPLDIYSPAKWFKAIDDPEKLKPPSWKSIESAWE